MNTPHHLTALLSLLLCSCGQSQSSDAPVPTVVDTTASSSSRDEAPERAEEEVTFGPFRREDLRGGYHVLYTVALDTTGTGDTARIDTTQFAQLWKERLITEIFYCDYRLPEKNLGYVQYDFDDWFLYVQGFSSGDLWAQVIEKESGRSMVGGNGSFYYLDVDTINQYVLLGKDGEGRGGVSDRKDTLFLFGADARNPELFFPLPEDVDETEWYIWTTIASLTRDRLVIQYESRTDGTKKAEYRRR